MVLEPKLRAHLNGMIAKFAVEVNKREPPGLRRVIGMYLCVRKAYQQANNDPERLYWKRYLGQLEAKADKIRSDLLKDGRQVRGHDPGWEKFAKKWRWRA